MARLNHPNIVAVYEFGQSGSYHYLLMEFVDGVNLREMERTQRLSPGQALSIVPKICDALQYAHDEGVVHRDIKPENILVDKKGRVKIADFGIAKILGAEQPHAPLTGVVGTPHYMAPEQVEKPQTVDHRADIYSVGVVFYEMLTGELPLGRFAAPSKKVQIDVRLDEIVLRALEKEPELRYQQVTQLKTGVETIASTPAPAASLNNRIDRETVSRVLFLTSSVVGGIVMLLYGASSHGPNRTALLDFGAVCTVFGLVLALKHWPQFPTAVVRKWKKISFWMVAAILFLDFILPHAWHFSTGLRFGVTQPWLFLPHDGFGAIFNPRAVSFFSGIVAVVTALILLATDRYRLNARYARWIGSLAVAVLLAVFARMAVEPYRTVNDAVAPEINPGSTVFVYKLSHRFQPGDIVVYRWFATGYPTKFLIGRVAELLNDNAISIERRNQEPQKILRSDIVGKVIFNTRSSRAADVDISSQKVEAEQTVQTDLDEFPAVVVATVPASGTTDVQPGITDIDVRFSKDMTPESWSWATAWDDSTPESIGDPQFIDARTCRLKVKLEPGRTYGFWLNSQKFGNFSDRSGNPSAPYLLIFETKGK